MINALNSKEFPMVIVELVKVFLMGNFRNEYAEEGFDLFGERKKYN